MQSSWSADQVRRLKTLRLDPVQNSPGKLLPLVRHFKGPKPSIFAVTEGSGEDHVSSGLARKVRDLVSKGELDWLLDRETEGIPDEESGGNRLTVDHEDLETSAHRTDGDPHYQKPREDHQKDLLMMIQRLHDAVHTPALKFEAQPIDFGLEGILPAADTAQERIVPLGYITPSGGFMGADPLAAVYGHAQGPGDVEVVLVRGIPTRIGFQWEEDPVWDAVQQHLNGDTLLDTVAEWQEDLVVEFRARGDLNTEVQAKAEEIFGAPVTKTSLPEEARLTPALVWLVRQELTRRSLGLGTSDLLDRLKQKGGELSDPRTGTYLTSGLWVDAGLVEMLGRLIGDLEGAVSPGPWLRRTCISK